MVEHANGCDTGAEQAMAAYLAVTNVVFLALVAGAAPG